MKIFRIYKPAAAFFSRTHDIFFETTPFLNGVGCGGGNYIDGWLKEPSRHEKLDIE